MVLDQQGDILRDRPPISRRELCERGFDLLRQSNRESFCRPLHVVNGMRLYTQQRVLLAATVCLCVWRVSMSIAEIASQLVEVIAKLQFLAVQLEKAAKEQDKPE